MDPATHCGGDIANDVMYVPGYKLGQHARFNRDQVSDWMYVDHGVLQGGFTVRVLRDRMSAAVRKQSDKTAPFRIE